VSFKIQSEIQLKLRKTFSPRRAYPQILNALSTLVANESHGGILDNICGTLGRLIYSNSSLVPLANVLPVFIKHLPLRQDYAENDFVFKSLYLVYRQGNEVLPQFLERIILTALTVLSKEQYTKDEVRDNIFEFVKQVRNDFPEKFNNVVNSDADISRFVQSLS
jgi:importin-4